MFSVFTYHKKLPLILDDRKEFLIRRYIQGETLNVGCGNLRLTNVVNLDLNPSVKPDVIADFHQLPFEDNKFDSVITIDTIEHSPTPKKMIRELQRVAKPNGTILIACNDFDIQPQNWSADPTHITYFNQKIFKETLEPMGFFTFSLYRGVLVAVNKPRKFDKILSIFYALYKRPINILKKR